MNPTMLLNILYAPLSYAHVDHQCIEGVDLAHMPASAANQKLIDLHQLPTGLDLSADMDQNAKQCLDHWARLPRISFLMGVQRLRTALIEERRYLSLDPLSQRFLCLPLRTPQVVSGNWPMNRDGLVSVGLSSLAPALRRLPSSFRARLPLLFPRSIDPWLRVLIEEKPNRQSEWLPLLFSFATAYAIHELAPAL
ncbi:Oxygen-regulated invasion protein OrgA [Pandoraea horticolens]|uniref:Oxygen-regulated invasion protein OrgA n=1 Tax=Pandoraea horticolens TaxID=2508298 RepID=A0A5E4XM55_9BURK|nr:type III secretion apparatus protein OrgA/MxiK [Pandoraea horticolens]VVE37132.1 Oxygen-regulated invasion protein OrgA [Pandoraea horticolens]